MSAQNSKPGGALSALLGMIGFSAIAGVLVTAMVTPAIAVTGVTAATSLGIFESLPNGMEINRLVERNEIYAKKDGEDVLIATVYDQNREEVAWDEVSQYAKDAAVSGEDRRFFEHGGVDVGRVISAAVGNIAAGGIESGASTLTMQLVKNINVQKALEIEDPEERRKAYLEAVDPEGFDRKLREMRFAISLEKKYTKQEILLAYLNISNFGNATYGIEAAAERYYGKTAADLELHEAASLVAIVQYPDLRHLENPENYAANQARRDQILGRMLADERITQAEYDEAIATPVSEETLNINPPDKGCRVAKPAHTQLWCDYILRSVKDLESLGADAEERRANWKRGGYKVYTSLDIDLNKVAAENAARHAPADEDRFELGAAVASVQAGEGWILVMAQNKDFDDSQEAVDDPTKTAINLAADQAYGGSIGFRGGSTFKPFTLVAWLAAGHGLNEVLDATPKEHPTGEFTNSCTGGAGGWNSVLKNYANERGPWTVVDATVASVNNVYAEMAKAVDLCDIFKVADGLGVQDATGKALNSVNPSFILGSSEDNVSPVTMAAAYAGFSNDGVFCEARAVISIVDSAGNELPGQEQECKRVIDSDVNAATVYALQRALSTYPSHPRDGTPSFGKTGTTDSSFQTWVMGASSEVATATWVGNIRGEQSLRTIGYAQTRHAIARPVLQAINDKYPGESFKSPPSRLLIGAGAPTLPSDIIGLSPANAKAALEALGLVYVEGGSVDSDLPEGVVAQTDPAPGSRVARGTHITVYLSKGNVRSVPNVVGMTENEARSRLQSAGFNNINAQCVPTDDPSREGIVSGQSPAPGGVQGNPTITINVQSESCGGGGGGGGGGPGNGNGGGGDDDDDD